MNGLDNSLPEGWVFCTLSDLIGFNGIIADGDWIESKDQDPAGDVRLIQLADIGDGIYKNKSERFLTSEKAKELDCTYLQAGDILIARMPDPLGRACIYPGDSKAAITAVDVCIFRAGQSGIANAFVMHLINSPSVRSEIDSLSKGTTRQRISRKNLILIKLPLPPLAEQKRIVAKVEELLAKVNSTKERLVRVQKLLKRFRQSVLTAAVTGKLTEEWREKHDIQDWDEKEFFDFCVLQRGYDLPIAKRTDGPYPIVTSGGIAAYHNQFKAKGPGVLIGRSGSTGKAHYIESNFWPHNTNLYVKDFKGNLPKYVYFYLLNFDFRSISASTAVPTLNRNNLRGILVNVPSPEEQHEIVRRAESLFTLLDKIEKQVALALARTEKLTQSILAKAFRGALVPTEAELARQEGREYEPASVLLERIKRERDLSDNLKPKRPIIKREISQMASSQKSNKSAILISRIPLIEILKKSAKGMAPEDLFKKAGFDENSVDEFYEELRKAVNDGSIVEIRSGKKQVLLQGK